jgi:hypothetical protein
VVERGRVGLYGRPGWGGCPFIDEPASPSDSRRATIKAHTTSTQPPSPLRNPGLGLRLMLIGRPEGSGQLTTQGLAHGDMRAGQAPPLLSTDYRSRLLVLMLLVMRAMNVSRGVTPRFSLVRRRTETDCSCCSLSPTTSI